MSEIRFTETEALLAIMEENKERAQQLLNDLYVGELAMLAYQARILSDMAIDTGALKVREQAKAASTEEDKDA